MDRDFDQKLTCVCGNFDYHKFTKIFVHSYLSTFVYLCQGFWWVFHAPAWRFGLNVLIKNPPPPPITTYWQVHENPVYCAIILTVVQFDTDFLHRLLPLRVGKKYEAYIPNWEENLSLTCRSEQLLYLMTLLCWLYSTLCTLSILT